MRQSKFREKRRLSQFPDPDARAVLTFVSRWSGRVGVGGDIHGARLYSHGYERELSADLIDAAMHFLVRFGFVVATGKLRWVVRKVLTAEDVEEACALMPVAYAPMLANETAFDMIQRVRKVVV